MKKSNRNITIRKLLRKDLRKVTWMDKESLRYVGDYIFNMDLWDEESDAFGLFVNDKLAAYFTIDELLEGAKGFEGLPDMTEDAHYINNVYVKDMYRGHRYGLKLIDEIMKDQSMPIYLIAKTKRLVSYYEKIGFIHLGDQCMVKYPENLAHSVIESEMSA